MRLKLATMTLLAMFTFTAGCSEQMPVDAKNALQNADKIEFYSLHPGHAEAESAEEKFHDWKVLGKTTVESAETRNSLVSALRRGVNASDGTVAGCFNPRHGLRVTHDEKVHDFVICFQCLQVQWFIDSEKQSGFLTTKSPRSVFNKVLKDADVPLPAQK